MNRDIALARLRDHQHELRSAGVSSIALVGSVARGDARETSDVDLLIRFGDDFPTGGFAYFGRLDELTKRLARILGSQVDVITEPVRKDSLRRRIERDRVVAF